MRSPCMTLLALMFGATLSADTLQYKDERLINSYISRQAGQAHGVAATDSKTIVLGDLNNDGVPDIAVLYSVEHTETTNYEIYLAVFVRSKTGLRPVANEAVGGKWYRAIGDMAVRRNTIELETTDYGDDDPRCCPTIKGKTRYVLVGSTLKEQK